MQTMVRSAVVRRSLRVHSAVSPTVQCIHPYMPITQSVCATNARNRHNDRDKTARRYATIAKSPNVVSQSVLKDIQALQDLHVLLTAPNSTLNQHAQSALALLERCHTEKRCIFVTGIGKSGIVARRLAATFASISVRSQWIHGSEWTHGDLGNLQPGDVVILLSHSGNTAELQSLPSLIAMRNAETIAIVGQESSALAQDASVTLVVPANDPPQCPVPSRSIVVQEAMCNAMVEHLMETLDRSNAFRDNHPGGAIGNGFTTS